MKKVILVFMIIVLGSSTMAEEKVRPSRSNKEIVKPDGKEKPEINLPSESEEAREQAEDKLGTRRK